MEDWARQRTQEELLQDMIEGAKACGVSQDRAGVFVDHITGKKPMTDQEMVRFILDTQREAG